MLGMGKASKSWTGILVTSCITAGALALARADGDTLSTVGLLGGIGVSYIVASAIVGVFGYGLVKYVAVRFLEPKHAALATMCVFVALAIFTAGLGTGAAVAAGILFFGDMSRERPKPTPEPEGDEE
jgi:hypothetical protein